MLGLARDLICPQSHTCSALVPMQVVNGDDDDDDDDGGVGSLQAGCHYWRRSIARTDLISKTHVVLIKCVRDCCVIGCLAANASFSPFPPASTILFFFYLSLSLSLDVSFCC